MPNPELVGSERFESSELAEFLEHHQPLDSLHDEVNFKLWKLAGDVVDDPVLHENFQKVMFDYVGHPDPEQRVGVHYPPGARIETKRGYRTFGIGCSAMVDPDIGELCVVRYDSERSSQESTSWQVLLIDLLAKSDYIQQRVVQSAKIEAAGLTANNAIIDLVPVVSHRGPSQLSLQLDDRLQTSQPVTRTHKLYYGRSCGPDLNVRSEAKYTVDVGLLASRISMEHQSITRTTEEASRLPNATARSLGGSAMK